MTESSSPDPDSAEAAHVLPAIAQRVLWLATAMVDHANRVRPNESGIKIGGHQASSASMVDIMVALWFHELRANDRISVKPHASPVLHAINYLLGQLDEPYLETLRAAGGLQSYPSRSKDPDQVDFSTGSVGIGATAPLWAAMAHRYAAGHFPDVPEAGRFISLLGDAELDEGAIWEAVGDPGVAQLGELLWVVDLNRQSLDRVVPDIQIQRLQGMFEAAGWQVLTLKWGQTISELFARPAGEHLRRRLERMPNEEYQRLLRTEAEQVPDRLLDGLDHDPAREELEGLLRSVEPSLLGAAIRDLGGHDFQLLLDSFSQADDHRPTVIFAYTIKGRGLPIEGHPNNHSRLLTEQQMKELAASCGTSLADPWQRFMQDTREGRLCARRADQLRRPPAAPAQKLTFPQETGRVYRKPVSTQATLGRLLTDLQHDVPQTAARIVTCSPDVSSTTNLGGWINKNGVWSASERPDWFADDAQRLLKWAETEQGQHIELGIAEVNLVSLLGELGTTWSRWGQRLIPIGVLYDPFLGRALEPWSYGIYAGGQSILVGTPSGVTLAPEGGAHQSVSTPGIGLQQPECIAWEPAFAQDLEWTLLHAMSRIGTPGGTSAYFRLSTRPIDPALAQPPDQPHLRQRRREHAIAGGYRLTDDAPGTEDITLVGVGAIMPEVISAARALKEHGINAGVVCLTSPDLIFRSLQQRGQTTAAAGSDILNVLFPSQRPAPLVTVMDGHPHTLSFLSGARGDRTRSLGVHSFGQSSSLADAHAIHGIDANSITNAALNLLGY